MKPIVICIVGASGSGKTQMSKFLYEGVGIPMVVSMTTRPKRRNEVDGVDHKFVSKQVIEKEKKADNILAYTQYGDYEYCALHSDIKDKPICSYVIDEVGLEYITLHFSHLYTIIAIYMERSLENRKLSGVSIERLHRDKKRYTLPPEYYDVIIDNNGTLGDFEENIIKIMSNKNNQKYYEIDGNSEEQTADIHRMCTRYGNRRVRRK